MLPHNWHTNQLQLPALSAPKVYSAYCGIGGAMYGYRLAGMSPFGGCDIDNKSLHYFKQFHTLPNTEQHFHHKPIKRLLLNDELLEPLKNIDILHASPAMPSFSSITKNERNAVDDTLELTQKLRPKVLVVITENNLSYDKFSGFLKETIRTLNSFGYGSQSFSIDCVDFGVAQKQEFSMIVATNLITKNRLELEPTITDHQQRVTCSQAFAHLTQKKPLPKSNPAYSSHEVIKKYHRLVAKGGNYGHIFQQFRNSRSYTNWTKIDDHSPSFTLTPLPLLSHYVEPRFLTLQEYICLSSFPQDISFTDMPETSKENEQTGKYLIGSSIPPFMIKHVAQSIQKAYFPNG